MHPVIKLFNTWTNAPVVHSDELRDKLELDQIDLIEIAMALEDDLEIEIPESALYNWITVGDIIKTVDLLPRRKDYSHEPRRSFSPLLQKRHSAPHGPLASTARCALRQALPQVPGRSDQRGNRIPRAGEQVGGGLLPVLESRAVNQPLAMLPYAVGGIPCTIIVRTFHHRKGSHSPNAPSSADFHGYTEMDWALYDRTGHRAFWLENKLTANDRSDIEITIYEYFTSDDK